MFNGQRIREAYPTNPEAETRAAQIRQQAENEEAAAFALLEHLRVEAAQAAEKLKPNEGETIAKSVDFYTAHRLRFRNAPAVSQIVEEFIQERQKLTQHDRNLAGLRHSDEFHPCCLSEVAFATERDPSNEKEICSAPFGRTCVFRCRYAVIFLPEIRHDRASRQN
jgi:hypothetical protein